MHIAWTSFSNETLFLFDFQTGILIFADKTYCVRALEG